MYLPVLLAALASLVLSVGIPGAFAEGGLAVGGAYAVMLVVMYMLTRSLFRVGFLVFLFFFICSCRHHSCSSVLHVLFSLWICVITQPFG